MCFGTGAFDTDIFQCAILYQRPSYPLSGDMIILREG